MNSNYKGQRTLKRRMRAQRGTYAQGYFQQQTPNGSSQSITNTNYGYYTTGFLSTSDEYNIDYEKEIALNRNTPPEILLELIKDEKKRLDYIIIKHPRVTRNVLTEIMQRATISEKIALAIVNHRLVDSTLLAKLATHPHWAVRYHVAMHPKVTSLTLIGLSNDTNKYVKLAAKHRLAKVQKHCKEI